MPRARLTALALVAVACRATGPEPEFELALSAQGGPGAGGGLALAQELGRWRARRVDFELGLQRQDLEDFGPRGDAWTQAWAGLRLGPAGTGTGVHARAGITWLRSEAETSALEDPGDYGGGYLGAGYTWALSRALATGPDLTVAFVDSEGDVSGSGALLQLAWRLAWRF
jgi:hypothetical protein